ncbi:MAG: hypothetical protein H0W72_03940 [Planctomycetes bacterium]|nr:hypothetical protein [Planctomycetota bacterium]
MTTLIGEEWQVEVDLSTCRARMHRRGLQVATVLYREGDWLELDPDTREHRAVLADAGEELRPFKALLKKQCSGKGKAG